MLRDVRYQVLLPSMPIWTATISLSQHFAPVPASFFQRSIGNMSRGATIPKPQTPTSLLSDYDWDSLRSDSLFITEIIGLLRNQLVAERGLT